MYEHTPLYGLVYHVLFLHASADEHLGCCHVLAITHNTAVNIPVPGVLCGEVFICLGIAGTCGSYV